MALAEDDNGDPAIAFDNLTQVVAAVAASQARIETVVDAVQKRLPNLKPSIDAMAVTLAKIGMNSASLAAQQNEARGAIVAAIAPLVKEIKDQRGETSLLVGVARAQDQQARMLWMTNGATAITCIGLSLGMAALARKPVAPPPEKTAVEAWEAGALSMSAANPELWDKLMSRWKLVDITTITLEACATKAKDTGKDQLCTVSIPAPKKSTPEDKYQRAFDIR